MENKPSANARDHAIDETIAQDCQSQTNSGFEDDSQAIPSSIGRYEIDRLLGRGGMGSVYLARDTNLRRDVALKVPKFSSETNPLLIERFYREARSAANLSHPNLCPVFDVGEVDGTHYIAMAYIKGRPLSDYVQPNKPPGSRVAATIIRKVALAMEDAHKSGILHRDLKPANIMMDHRKEPIVMDFGLACPQDSNEDTRLTREGTLLGSPAYMPPEQLTGRTEQIGPTSDVYSLGIVLFELLTGRLPFDGVESTIALIGRILSEDPKEIRDIRSDVDSGLAEICRKAMAKDVAKRYPTMVAFANDLSKYLRSKGNDEKVSLADPKAMPLADTDATTIRLQEQTKLVRTLCKSGQLEAAAQILDEIVSNPDAKDSETARWANSMITQVQSRITKQMSTAKSEPTATMSEGDPFANLPSPVATAPGAALGTATPLAYARPKSKTSWSAKSGNAKWILPGLIVALGIGVVAIGGVVFRSRRPAQEPKTALPSAQSSAQASSLPMDSQVARSPNENRAELNGREPGRSRFADGPLPERRDQSIRPGELMELDTDGDGKVALSQLGDTQRRTIRFADRDGDGFLDRSEINQIERRGPRQSDGFDEGAGPNGNRPFKRPNGPRGRDSADPGPRGQNR